MQGGRGAGRAWLDPGHPPSERKACPRCPRVPPRAGAAVREAGARAAQAETIRDSAGPEPGRADGRPGAGDRIRQGWGAEGEGPGHTLSRVIYAMTSNVALN